MYIHTIHMAYDKKHQAQSPEELLDQRRQEQNPIDNGKENRNDFGYYRQFRKGT